MNKNTGNEFLIVIAMIIALLLSNNRVTCSFYTKLINNYATVDIGFVHFKANLSYITNEILMSFFFLLIGVKLRQIISNTKKKDNIILFSITSGILGMIIPCILYLALNFNNNTAIKGWAIPAATDIVFSYKILNLFKKQSSQLNSLLIMQAIVDDIGSVIIIAAYYTGHIIIKYILITILLITTLIILNLYKVQSTLIYFLISIILWKSSISSGVHPSVSSMITGFLIPQTTRSKHNKYKKVFKLLNILVDWYIIPVFAFVSSGVTVIKDNIFRSLFSNISLGIMSGLLIGKPLSVIISYLFLIRICKIKRPNNISNIDILNIGILCSIGFTMSMFINSLAFDNYIISVNSKISILICTFISSLLSTILIRNKNKFFNSKTCGKI